MSKQIIEYLIRNPGKVTYHRLFAALGLVTVAQWDTFGYVLADLCHRNKLVILYKPEVLEPLGQNREVEFNVGFAVETLCERVIGS